MRLGQLVGLLPKAFGPQGYHARKGVIFLLSHMRGYTTLLSHLIGSHPEVAGYAEAHQRYHNPLDFLALAEKIERSGAGVPAGRFLFDKILHDHTLRPGVLKREEVSVLVMARPAIPTISSILRGRHGGITNVADASAYYQQRLLQLRQAIEQRAGRVLYLDADRLIDQSQPTLSTIGNYLGLQSPIESSYRIFPLTGQRKFGDPSARIQRGEIDPHSSGESLPQSLERDQAEHAHAAFRAFALRHAEQVIGGET